MTNNFRSFLHDKIDIKHQKYAGLWLILLLKNMFSSMISLFNLENNLSYIIFLMHLCFKFLNIIFYRFLWRDVKCVYLKTRQSKVKFLKCCQTGNRPVWKTEGDCDINEERLGCGRYDSCASKIKSKLYCEGHLALTIL